MEIAMKLGQRRHEGYIIFDLDGDFDGVFDAQGRIVGGPLRRGHRWRLAQRAAPDFLG